MPHRLPGETNRSQQGLTFLEVLIALSILAIALTAILPSFVSYMKVNGDSELRTQASSVAQQYFERYRLMDPTSMPTSGAETSSLDYRGRTYQVTTTYCPQASYCGAGSRGIHVSVSHNGTEVFNAETVYTQVNVQSR